MQSIFGGGELLTSDLTFCMKGRECNNTPSQQNICCSLSIPSFVFIYYYFIYVSREILTKGTKKPRMFVFIYVCGVCVSVYVCIIYIWVCGDRFCMALVAGLFVLLLHSGCCTVGLHCCWHGIRGKFCDGITWIVCALQHTSLSIYSMILAPSEFGRVLWKDVVGFPTLWRWA